MKTKILSCIAICILICFACNQPPETFLKTYDEPGVWKSIEVREGLTKEDAWKTVVDAIAQKFDLEVLDKESGYLRTSWKFSYIIQGKVSDKYRSRIIIKFQSGEAKLIQVKSEANWLETDGWILGYDTRLLEDVYGDLHGRIGRVRR